MELHQKNEDPDKTVIPCRSIFQGCNHVSTTIMKLCKVISKLLQCNKTVEGGDGNKVTRLSEKKKKGKNLHFEPQLSSQSTSLAWLTNIRVILMFSFFLLFLRIKIFHVGKRSGREISLWGGGNVWSWNCFSLAFPS